MGAECGRVEGVCRQAGMTWIEDDGLLSPYVARVPGRPQVACIPAWARDGSREAMFAWCVVDTLIAERGIDALVHCLGAALVELQAMSDMAGLEVE